MDMATEKRIRWEAERQRQPIRDKQQEVHLCLQHLTEVHQFTRESLATMLHKFNQIGQTVAGTPHEAVMNQIVIDLKNTLARHHLKLSTMLHVHHIAYLQRKSTAVDTPQNEEIQPSFFDQSFEKAVKDE